MAERSQTWQNRIVGYGNKPPDQFLASPFNFRRHPKEQQAALRGVLNEVGWIQNVIVNKTTGHMIDGHLRVELALRHDAPMVPVTYVELTEAEEKKALITLDPLSAMAYHDAEQLDALLREVSTDDAAVQALLDSLASEPLITEGLTDPDDVPDVPAEPVTKPGDLWLLGRHRLLCGDATVVTDVETLMGGDVADLVFTSPPYAEQRDYGGNVAPWDQLMRDAFSILPVTDEAQVLVNLGLVHRDGEWMPYWDGWVEWMRSAGWRRFGWYVWDQGPGMAGDWNGRFAPSFEFVFHFNRKSAQPGKWVDKQFEYIKVKNRRTMMRRKDGTVGPLSNPEASLQPTKIPDNVIRVMRYKARDVTGHPAMFPVELPEYIIQSWPGLLYEPFSGSGTGIIAAERTGQTCYAMELTPAYVDVAVTRYERFTGQTATLAPALHETAAD